MINSRRAILAALKAGRHLSQLDCREFQVEDMRTVVSHLEKFYSSTHVLCKKWISTPLKRRVKEYWLEPIA